jgi:hypothetical protein
LLARYTKEYVITVSTPQACVLMLFNNANNVTFDEVRRHLNLSEDEAKRQLLTLAAGKFKLLKKEPSGKDVNPTDSFSVNSKFTNDKRTIKVPTISAKVSVEKN